MYVNGLLFHTGPTNIATATAFEWHTQKNVFLFFIYFNQKQSYRSLKYVSFVSICHLANLDNSNYFIFLDLFVTTPCKNYGTTTHRGCHSAFLLCSKQTNDTKQFCLRICLKILTFWLHETHFKHSINHYFT